MKMERNQNECEDDCKWKIEHIGQRKKLQCKKNENLQLYWSLKCQ